MSKVTSPPPIRKPPRPAEPEPDQPGFPHHWVAIGLAIVVIILLLALLPLIRSTGTKGRVADQQGPAEPAPEQSVENPDEEELPESSASDPEETTAASDSEEEPKRPPAEDDEMEIESIVDETDPQTEITEEKQENETEEREEEREEDEEEMEPEKELPSLTDSSEKRVIVGSFSQPDPNASPLQNSKKKTGKGGLQGRNQQSRKEMARTGGGTAESELAVDRGIQWLINHQLPDGSWHLKFHQGPCNGRCGNPGSLESTTAATGLALMALLGAGHTHREGPYQKQAQAGLDYLVSRMQKTEFGGKLADGLGTMYAHGIATIALSEAFAMTGDNSLRNPVKQAQEYIANAQHVGGGWRYTPQTPGDMTVTGWQLMALKSGELAGIDPPRQVVQRARQFLDTMTNNGGRTFGYISPGQKPSPTAIGLLMQMYGGTQRDKQELQGGVQFLAQMGPSNRDIYFNYYGTLVMHHYGGAEWEMWNAKMRDYLIQTQHAGGHQDGSWHFPDSHGSAGGRLYNTAMAVMILEVYYRYMPLYDRGH